MDDFMQFEMGQSAPKLSKMDRIGRSAMVLTLSLGP